MIYADLHVHTDYSDGVHSIENTIRLASSNNIKSIAITDHDTIFHFDEIKKYCDAYKMEMIPGVEMSCYDYDVHKKVHVVGLWINQNPQHVATLCHHTLTCRDNYHKELLKQLNDKGFDITYEEVKKYARHNIVFKMHLYQAIVAKYPEYNNLDKYRSLFMSQTSYETDLKMGYIDVKEGIDAIHQDGGIAILAHPCEYDNYPEIDKYVSYGIDGIEISHPSMKEEDYPLVMKYIDQYHLLKSGGSDFHNLKFQNFGINGLTKEQYKELVERIHNR